MPISLNNGVNWPLKVYNPKNNFLIIQESYVFAPPSPVLLSFLYLKILYGVTHEMTATSYHTHAFIFLTAL